MINIVNLQDTSYVVGVLGSSSFLSLLGSRMFITLKEAGKPQVYEQSDAPPPTRSSISDPQFNIPGVSSGMHHRYSPYELNILLKPLISNTH